VSTRPSRSAIPRRHPEAPSRGAIRRPSALGAPNARVMINTALGCRRAPLVAHSRRSTRRSARFRRAVASLPSMWSHRRESLPRRGRSARWRHGVAPSSRTSRRRRPFAPPFHRWRSTGGVPQVAFHRWRSTGGVPRWSGDAPIRHRWRGATNGVRGGDVAGGQACLGAGARRGEHNWQGRGDVAIRHGRGSSPSHRLAADCTRDVWVRIMG